MGLSRVKFPRLLWFFAVVVCLMRGDRHFIQIETEATDLFSDTDPRYKDGQIQYEAIQQYTRMPKYSDCWVESLQELEAGCKQLTDDIQHRLSLRFTNCFLLKTGRETYPCEPLQELEECTKDMKPEAYNTYTEFFTHTQNICFFLQSQIWQEETENTVHKLADNSAKVAKQIADSSTMQEEMMKQQNMSIENQQVMLERGNELKKTLEDSTVDVHHMLNQFKESTVEQRQLIFEVFDRVNSLQSVVMGEFTGFYSLIFYAISVLISYLLTSTSRTSGARFWLFVLMTVNMVFEQLVASFTTAEMSATLDEQGNLIDSNTVVYGRMWLCRKFFTALGVLLIGYVAYSYRDYIKLNNQLLVEITKQNSELKHLLEHSQSPAPSRVLSPALNGIPPVTIRGDRSLHHQTLPSLDASRTSVNMNNSLLPSTDVPDLSSNLSFMNRSSTGYGTDSEFSESSSSESGESDHTFTVDGNASDSDADSFMTTESGRWSRGSTPALLEELNDLRKATPLREMTPQHGGFQDSEGFLTPDNPGEGGSSGRRRGRPRGRKSYQSTPPGVRPGLTHYNLRSRRGAVPAQENPVVGSESAHDFGRVVKHLASIAMRNSVKARVTLARREESGPKFFSSDED